MSDLIALLDATLRLISNNGADKKKLSKIPVSGVKPGGYPVDMFLDGLSQTQKENYQCGICFLIAKNPCHCLNKHQFCRSCVTVWAGSGESENHNKCPVCRVKGYYLPSGRVADSLNSKTVRCLLRSCVWTGQLRDMQYHRHILSKKLAEEEGGQFRIHRKNSDSSESDSCCETDSCNSGSRTPSPQASPVLPRIVTTGSSVYEDDCSSAVQQPTSPVLCSRREPEVTPSSPSQVTFLQMLRSASSSVDMPTRTTRSVPTTLTTLRSLISSSSSPPVTTTPSSTTVVAPASAEVLSQVRCCRTPRPRSPTPAPPARRSPAPPVRRLLPPHLPASSATFSYNNNNNRATASVVTPTIANNNNNNTTATLPGRRSVLLPSIQNNAGSAETITNTAVDSSAPIVYCRGSGSGVGSGSAPRRSSGPKEYERLRARMRETRVRLEHMETTRRELARYQERQRLQHLVEVRELGRQLNEVTFQIRRLLNQMSTTDEQNPIATPMSRNGSPHHHQ